MTAPQSDRRLMRHYIDAAWLLTLVLVLLPISGLADRNIVADGLAVAFTLYVGWLTLRLRRANNPHAILFAVASLSFALFMLSLAVGSQFGTPETGNWFFPSVSLVAGLIALCSNVALYAKAQPQI